MMENIQAILDKAEVLPVSPSLLPKLLPQLADVNGDFDEVVNTISFEQTLTARLLQICNSAFFGQEEPVETVTEAVNRVGYQSVYLLVAKINGSNSFIQPAASSVDSAALWKHSVITAFNASFVAESAGLDGNLLLTAGLMHDIGKVVIAQNLPMDKGIHFHQPATPDSLVAEAAAFGCNHAELGASLLEKWNLPPLLVNSVRYHHHPQNAGDHARPAACVAIGNAIAHSELHPKIIEQAPFTSGMEILGLPTDNLKRWQRKFDDSSELINSMSQLLG